MSHEVFAVPSTTADSGYISSSTSEIGTGEARASFDEPLIKSSEKRGNELHWNKLA